MSSKNKKLRRAFEYVFRNPRHPLEIVKIETYTDPATGFLFEKTTANAWNWRWRCYREETRLSVKYGAAP